MGHTPRPIPRYRALGASLARFAHIPPILDLDESRLSKRHGAASVMQHHDNGDLLPAMVDFLARHGWSHGDQALFTRTELIEHFSLENVGTSAAIFSPATLVRTHLQSLQTTPAASHPPPATVSRRPRPSRPRRYCLAHARRRARTRGCQNVARAVGRAARLRGSGDHDRGSGGDHAFAPRHRARARRCDDRARCARDVGAVHYRRGHFTTPLRDTGSPPARSRCGCASSPRATPRAGIVEVLDVLGRDRPLARLHAAQKR